MRRPLKWQESGVLSSSQWQSHINDNTGDYKHCMTVSTIIRSLLFLESSSER